MYFSSSSSPNFLNMEGSGVKMKEPTFVIFCFTNFHHQTFSLYSLRVFSFSFALWMCNFMFCYLTLILTTISREAVSQISQAHRPDQINPFVHIWYFSSHASFFICHTQPTSMLLPQPVRPCLELPLFTSLAHIAACCAHTLRCGLTSEPAWNEVVTAFCFTRTSWLESHCADGHPLVVFFASRKLVPFSLFLSPLPFTNSFSSLFSESARFLLNLLP